MRILLTNCVLLFFTIHSNAQTIYFNNTYESPLVGKEIGTSLLLMDSTGSLALGESVDTNARYIMLVKTDWNGIALWTKLIGSLQRAYYTSPRSLAYTQIGNYVFCGVLSLDSVNGTTDSCLIFLCKINSNGDTIWMQYYGQNSRTNLAFNSISIIDGGYAICGQTNGFGALGYDMVLIRTGSSGSLLWSKVYGDAGLQAAFSVEQTTDGGFILGGYTSTGMSTSDDLLVIKTDSNGVMQWQKTFGTTNDDNSYTYVHQAMDGGYLLTGTLDTSSTAIAKWESYVVKLDPLGNIIWDKYYNTQYLDALSVPALELPDSSFIVLGGTRVDDTSGAYYSRMIKITQTGDVIWERLFTKWGGNNDNYFRDIKAVQDSGFIVCGFVTNFSVPAGQDLWLLKVNCLGFDSPPQAGFTYQLAGTYTVQFTDTSKNTGTWLWYFGDGDSSALQNPLHLYPDTGNYAVTLITEACGDRDTVTTVIQLDSFLTGQDDPQQGRFEMKIYPNPAVSEPVTVQFRLPEADPVSVQMNSVMGQEVFKLSGDRMYPAGMHLVHIYTSQLRNGVYFVRLISRNRTYVQKLLILR